MTWANAIIISPTNAYIIVLRALADAFESPPEVTNLKPPIMTMMTAIIPPMAERVLIIFLISFWTLDVPPLHPSIAAQASDFASAYTIPLDGSTTSRPKTNASTTRIEMVRF